jgi:type I restriction enzyme S subunit
MSWTKTKIGEFLKRTKIPIDIKDSQQYSRVKIRINHNGVSLRDTENGKRIGTKKQFVLRAGQFIMSKIDARYGAFGIAPNEVDGAIITGNFWAYDVNKKKVNIEWFNQFTNSPDFYELCERASSGITHRKYLDEKFFLNHEIDLPTIDDQLKDIEKIKTQQISFGGLSTELTNQLDLVKQLRQAFLREAMQGKLVAQDPNDEPASELLRKIKAEKELLIKEKKIKKEKELSTIKSEELPFEIPANWVWCRLGEVCQIKGGKRVPNGYKLLRSESPHIYIRVSDMKNGSIDDSDLHYIDEGVFQKIKQYIITKDDLYMTIVGATIGKCGLVPDKFHNMNLTENAARIIPHQIDKTFLWYCLDSPFCQNQFIDKTKQVGVQKMALNRLSTSLLPLPTHSEQLRIVAKLEQIMRYCDELEQSIKQSQTQNEQLLQQVLREALQPKKGYEIKDELSLAAEN